MTARRLHVVFVDHVARLSGAEMALLHIVPELSKHVDVSVVLGEDGPLVERLRGAGARVEVLPLAPRLRDLRKDTVRPHSVDLRALTILPGYIVALRRRFRELDADVVHTNSLKAAFYAGLAGRLAGVPVVWHARDRLSRDYLPPAAVALARLAARVLPSAVIANSRTTMSTLPHLGEASVVYNPVVPDAPALASHGPGRAELPVVVGMIGRLAPWKGQSVFLDAFAEAFGGGEVRARLIGTALFGEDAYAASLRDQVERLGIAEQVEFRGFREDIWSELRELDILVHCSVRPEPFGQVVLEGFAAGVPVIAAAKGGPAELITPGEDGILTSPGNAHELAGALRELAADEELRARLAAAGRRRSEEFTPERTVSQLLEVYSRVTAARRPRTGARRRARRLRR